MGDGAPDPLNDTFFVSLGTYLVNTDTTVRLDGTTQDSGTRVDWDRTFGDATATQFRVDAMWRFAERHKLRALWFNTSRSSSRTIDEEIDWGGETFPVNSRVKGDVNWDIYQLAYEYSFLRRDTYELSASIGAYYAAFDSNLSATITNPGGTTQRNAKRDASVDLPLPVLGLRGLWALPYDLSLDVSGQWFSAYDRRLQWQPPGLPCNADVAATDVARNRPGLRLVPGPRRRGRERLQGQPGLDVPGPDDLLQRLVLIDLAGTQALSGNDLSRLRDPMTE